MIKPEQVPKEAIAELRAFMNSCDCDDCVSVAIAAALSAWPGVTLHQKDINAQYSYFVLPLTEKPSDE